MDQDLSNVQPSQESLLQDSQPNDEAPQEPESPLTKMKMDEELWKGGPTRADVEEIKEKFPDSDVRASLFAGGQGVVWRTVNRLEWRKIQEMVRTVQDQDQKDDLIFKKIVLCPDCNDPSVMAHLPAGIIPAVLQEFQFYSGFQPLADSVKL